MRGRFIVLEGIDGSGTTTQCRALCDVLRARGHGVLATHQPSDRAIGRLVRERLAAAGPRLDPRALALLFAADRLDHVAGAIEPALARGDVVVCDRYVVSSWVYQSLSCAPDWVRAINRHAPWPDLTVLIDVPVAEARARVGRRQAAEGTPAEIFDAEALQARVADAYREVLGEPDLAGVVRLDGTRPPAEITAAIVAACAALGL
jgi:dTMP kinase